MCCSTKEKIASVLRQLTTERPLQKITVQNLMDAANMKRQSFYYHFKDIQDVLMWIYEQDIIIPLSNSDLPFDQWIVYGYSLLDKDRGFYRKALNNMHQDFSYKISNQLYCPRIAKQLYETDQLDELNEHQIFVIELFSRALISHAADFVNSRRPLDKDYTLAHIHCLFETIGHPIHHNMTTES